MGLFSNNLQSIFSTPSAQGIASRVAAQAQAQQAQQAQQGRNLAKSTPQQRPILAPFSYGPPQELEMGPTSTPRKLTPTYVPTRQEMAAQAQSQEKAYRDSMAELQALVERQRQDAIRPVSQPTPQPQPQSILRPTPQTRPQLQSQPQTRPQLQPQLQSQPQANYGGAQDSGFNKYGFDRNLVDYLNKQKKLSTFDAGISYDYDPATQTFTGGTMAGPVKKTLQQMQTESQKTPLMHFKKGGQVKVAQDTKKKYTSGGKINLNECGVSTAPKGKKNSNW